MKKQFNIWLNSYGISILTMPSKNTIAEMSTNFNKWLKAKADLRNYKETEYANKFMVRKFIEKILA